VTGTTVVADPAVLERWRTGPRWYYVIAAMIESDAVERRRRQAADALGDLLHPTTPGQPHVTVWALGFEPARWWRPRRATLQVGSAATFSSAAYLSVTSSDIAGCRAELLAGGPGGRLAPEGRGEPYVPHVTVGTYRRRVPLAHVRRTLLRLSGSSVQPVPATVRLVAVDTRSPTGALHLL
jgi:hypothetical protein